MGLETQPGRMLLGTALGGCLAEPLWLQELQPKLFPSCRPALPGLTPQSRVTTVECPWAGTFLSAAYCAFTQQHHHHPVVSGQN